MTPPRHRVRARCAWLFAGALAACPCAVAALTLSELTSALRGVAERRADFEETKYIAALTAPLTRRGTLSYTRPDRLQMRVESPYFERLEIAGDTLTIERKSGVTRVALSTQPLLAAFIESLRATLAGDGVALADHFDVAVAGTLAQWTLKLTPRDRALGAVVARIELSGSQSELTRVDLHETTGDRAVMTITAAARPGP